MTKKKSKAKAKAGRGQVQPEGEPLDGDEDWLAMQRSMLEQFAAARGSAEGDNYVEGDLPGAAPDLEPPGAVQDGFDMGEAFQVRRIEFLGEQVPVLLQNRNGPCALLAIANGLLLRGSWNIGERETSITSVDLVSRLSYLCEEMNFQAMQENFTLAQSVREVVSTMPKLLDGLLVNCDFGSCTSFQDCSSTLVGTGLFKLFKLQLYHVWVDPEVHKVVPTWNDLQDLLAKAAEVQSLRSQDLSPEDEELLTKAALLQEWWEANRAQSTDRGLKELQKQVQTGEVCVLFRNNHFCTVYRPGRNSPCPHCCTLLTDECFQESASPVWETLTVEESQFLDAFFCPMEDLPPSAPSAPSAGYASAAPRNVETARRPADDPVGPSIPSSRAVAPAENTNGAETGPASTTGSKNSKAKSIYNCSLM